MPRRTWSIAPRGARKASTPALTRPARRSISRRRRSTTAWSMFEHGTTKLVPGPRRELGSLGRRARIHLPPAPGRQVPDDRRFHADARLQRRRRGLLVRPPGQQEQPVVQLCRRAAGSISTACRCRTSSSRIDKVDDYTVKFTLNRPNAPMLAEPRHGLRLDRLQGICRQADGRRPSRGPQPEAGRHRAVPASSTTRRTRSSATRPIPTIGAASRRSTT